MTGITNINTSSLLSALTGNKIPALLGVDISKATSSTELESDENQQLTEQGQTNQESLTPVEKKRYFVRKRIKVKPDTYQFFEVPNEKEYDKFKESAKIAPAIYKAADVTETSVPGLPPELNTDELNKAEKIMPGLKVFLGIENEQEAV